MAGSFPGFDSTAFRDGIRFAYDMGASPVEEERATFLFASQLVYNTHVDADNVPFDPQATVQRIPPRQVKVPCGIEYFDAEGQITNFGVVTPSRIAVTLLDEDYRKVKGCEAVCIGGDRYLYRRTEPPSGLFDVGLYVMHFTSENET